MDIMDKDFIIKSSEISGRILNIMENRDEFTQGDLQGAIEAQVIIAIRYGYNLHKNECPNTGDQEE